MRQGGPEGIQVEGTGGTKDPGMPKGPRETRGEPGCLGRGFCSKCSEDDQGRNFFSLDIKTQRRVHGVGAWNADKNPDCF